MPTIARHLLPVTEPRRRPNHRPRVRPGPTADDRSGTSAASPEAESPARALAVAALAVVRAARRPGPLPDAWLAQRFGREVDLVRIQLGPIRSRAVLAASFGREAFHGAAGPRADRFGPVAVAYAIRWLELGDGVGRPAFPAWLAESAPLRGMPVG